MKTPIDELLDEYNNGKLDKYVFIDKINKINKSLFYFSKRIKNTDIKKIEILDDSLIFTTRKNNIKLYFSGRDRRGTPFEILNFGNYEEQDNYFLMHLISDDDVIFDIGANIGWYSILFSKHFSKSKIFSFEPVSETFDYLQRNIELNKAKNIKAFNFGFSDFHGEEALYYCPEGSVIASRENLVNSTKAKLIKCQFKTMNSFVPENELSKIDFLKCDVEGAELAVLQGADQILKKYLPIIFIEIFHEWAYKFGYHPNEILNMLHKLGYKCFYPQSEKILKLIDNLNEKPNEERLNYFFLHKDKHKKIIQNFV